MESPERIRVCSAEDLSDALRSLAEAQVRAADWPSGLSSLDSPGLYSWWVDPSGAGRLTGGLGVHLAPGRIYAGQTGATAWPSGLQRATTLRHRIGGNHLGGTIRGSTFRLTLAAALMQELGLVITGPRMLDRPSEHLLSGWIRQHLSLAVYPFKAADTLADLEDRVLAVLDPPLNLEAMSSSPLRTRLSELRRVLTDSARTKRNVVADASAADYQAESAPSRRSTHVTLHEEIAEILRENGNRWMTTAEVAGHVNGRRRYTKRDGSAVTAFQVHGRTRNYSHIFEREGSMVRLREQR